MSSRPSPDGAHLLAKLFALKCSHVKGVHFILAVFRYLFNSLRPEERAPLICEATRVH